MCDPISRQVGDSNDKNFRKEALWIIAPEAKFQEPTDNKTRAGLGKFLRPNTPYDNYMESQGIPIYRDIGVRRVQDLPRKPWKRMGGSGTFIQLLGTEGLWGCYVVEVPGAGALNAEKHMYEEQFLVVDGRGTTEVWIDGNPKKLTFEWQKGSIFAIPMNATHRIVNATSSPALLLAGTTAPNVMNIFGNEDFIFNCPYQFKDRFDPIGRLLQVQRRSYSGPGPRSGDAADQHHSGRYGLRTTDG